MKVQRTNNKQLKEKQLKKDTCHMSWKLSRNVISEK